MGRELLGLGECSSDPAGEPRVGDSVDKTGRTTGTVCGGRVVGVNTTTHVNYGPEGTAKFVGQVTIELPSGQFSAAGDSGSLIVTSEGRRPYALLFAGGGRQTIASPVSFVLEHWPGSSFE